MGEEWPKYPPSPEVLNERVIHTQNMLSNIKKQLDRVEEKIEASQWITRIEWNNLLNTIVMKEGRYWLVERLVFGLVGLILVAVVTAILFQIGIKR